MTSCAAFAVPVTLFVVFPVVSATYSPVSEFTNPTSDSLDPPLLENLYVTTAEPVIVNSNPDDPAFPISTDVTALVFLSILLTTSPNVIKFPSANFVPSAIFSLSSVAVSVVASNVDDVDALTLLTAKSVGIRPTTMRIAIAIDIILALILVFIDHSSHKIYNH